MKRFCGYLFGIALALVGLLGLASEILDQKSNFIFFGYVLSSLFLLGGILLVWALRSGYGGGLWTTAGYLLAALGTIYAGSILDDFLKHRSEERRVGKEC